MGRLFSKSPEPVQPQLVDDAWRDILKDQKDWSEQAHADFKRSLTSRFGATEKVKRANILLLGAIGSGKSSFVNSVLSVSKGRIVNKAYTGAAERSFTTKYGQYTDRNFFKNFILHDSMGVEPAEGEGFYVSDVVYMIQGKIPKNYQFNPRAPISENDPVFDPNPPDETKVHCVIYFVDATVLSAELPRELIRKIGHLQDKIKEMDVPRLLCITKIDLLCQMVKDDLTKTFYSIQVRDAVDRACEIFKLPRTNIHPIKNYEHEVDTKVPVDMLLMYPLRQALDFATDFLEEQE